MDKKKLFKIIGSVALDLAIVGAIAFTVVKIVQANTYSLYYVDGSSMYPTLKGDTSIGGGCYFGLTNHTQSAIDKIERFDIISTYYNFENTDYAQPYERNAPLLDTATLKIKRVIGIPGDTINISNDYFSISFTDKNGDSKKYEFTSENCPFGRFGDANHQSYPYDEATYSISGKQIENFELGEDEYFVMGDNWVNGQSKDSCSTGLSYLPHSCIYKECIYGVAVNVQGSASVETCMMCPDCKHENEIGCIACLYCSSQNIYYYAELKDEQYFKKEIDLTNVWQKYIGSLDI